MNDEEEKLPRRGVATVTTSQHTRRPGKKKKIYINDRIPRAPVGAGIDLGRAAPAAAATADRRRPPPVSHLRRRAFADRRTNGRAAFAKMADDVPTSRVRALPAAAHREMRSNQAAFGYLYCNSIILLLSILDNIIIYLIIESSSSPYPPPHPCSLTM